MTNRAAATAAIATTAAAAAAVVVVSYVQSHNKQQIGVCSDLCVSHRQEEGERIGSPNPRRRVRTANPQGGEKQQVSTHDLQTRKTYSSLRDALGTWSQGRRPSHRVDDCMRAAASGCNASAARPGCC